MKHLIFILILLLSFNTYSQKELVVNDSTITNAEHIIDKYSGKITDAFNQGIKDVAPLAKEGFEVVVRLQIAKGIINLLVPFFAIIFCIIAIRTYNVAVKDCPQDFSDGKYGGFCVGSIIITAVLMIASPFAIYDAITRLMAPEWFAIKEIMDLF